MNERKTAKQRATPDWVSGHVGPRVALDSPDFGTAHRPVDRAGSWTMSSFDLAQGVDIFDGPDTISAEQFDALFAARKP